MINRFFRIRIRPSERENFEQDFKKIAVEYVKKQPGLVSYTLGFPTKWKPDDYMLLTVWETEADLIRFAGANWQVAVYPDGMEKYVLNSWVDHFISVN